MKPFSGRFSGQIDTYRMSSLVKLRVSWLAVAQQELVDGHLSGRKPLSNVTTVVVVHIRGHLSLMANAKPMHCSKNYSADHLR